MKAKVDKKEIFVNFEIAKLASKFGFNHPCLGEIDQTEYIHIHGTKYPMRGACCYETYEVPTYEQLINWFYERKIFIELKLLDMWYNWYFKITSEDIMQPFLDHPWNDKVYALKNQALNDAFQEAFKLLKK